MSFVEACGAANEVLPHRFAESSRRVVDRRVVQFERFDRDDGRRDAPQTEDPPPTTSMACRMKSRSVTPCSANATRSPFSTHARW